MRVCLTRYSVSMLGTLGLGLLAAPAALPQAETVLHVEAGADLEDVVLLLREAVEREAEVDLVVELAGGTYVLDRPLVLGPAVCGDERRAVVWRAASGASVTWSGGRGIEDWRLEEDGTWSTPLDEVRGPVRQLFVDGVRRPRARWPREGWLRVESPGPDGRTAFTFARGDLSTWSDLGGADLVFLHDWSMSRVRVASVDEGERRVELAQSIGGYLPFLHIANFEPHPRYALENLRTAWSASGEWIHDTVAGRIRYRPLPGEDPEHTRAVVPVLERLVEVRGEAGRPARGLEFQGITFAHTRSMDPVGGYAGLQAAFHDEREDADAPRFRPPSSAVRVTHADGVVFDRCRFEQLGASGLWLGEGVRNARVSRSLFTDLGAGGLLIGEPTEPEQASGLTSRVVCEDSTFDHCGVLCYGAVGIWIGIAEEVRVRHNELRNLPYSGISLGWIWNARRSPSQGHVIERNHIHHVMQMLSDGGGIYTLGRQPDSFLRHNLIHHVPVNAGRAGSNGFFVDQGSTAMVFEGNVVHSIDRSPIRFHKAGENTLRENVLATSKGVPAFRYNSCSADLMTFEANRIVAPARWTPPSAAELGAGPR